ncbi:hypothetical protein C4546_01240 [Candidatus Parcubacteria bacterium]|jgi:hypothetical protein|nr:MAG: hypothetical protein C4546_01240 [Candidatus Parcubacteria bacterium]
MKKIFIYSLPVLAAVVFLGANSVSAKGPQNTQRGIGYQAMLETKAKTLGLTSEQLQQELVSGKTLLEIAQSKGINLDKIKSQVQTQQKIRLDAMVKAGIITQSQADERLRSIQSRQADCTGNGNFAQGRGFGRGMGTGLNR